MQIHYPVQRFSGRISFKNVCPSALRFWAGALLFTAVISTVAAQPTHTSASLAYKNHQVNMSIFDDVLADGSLHAVTSPATVRISYPGTNEPATKTKNPKSDNTTRLSRIRHNNQDLWKHLVLGTLTLTILLSIFRFSRRFATTYPIPKL